MDQSQVLEGFAPPAYFFSAELDCQHHPDAGPLPRSKKFQLPELSKLYNEASFALVGMGWQSQGLMWRFEVAVENGVTVAYPEIRQGDSIELFIDTRDLKTARTTHRFCHHFFFLPEAVEGLFCGEISRFRTEDSHPLCKSEEIEYRVEPVATGYVADIMIPKECLVGFDPSECNRIGFSYRVNRSKGTSQQFAFSSELTALERHPYLWTTLHLRNG
ncbi:MAG: hypothetical protein JSR46_11090 [Verrucomicrobia bacterium]|nr:hypothetical protein [Verrucomicrobiota bacterium]